MATHITIDDFPADKPNCGNCTYRGAGCARAKKAHPNGMVKNSCTGNYDGVIYLCTFYEGKFKPRANTKRQWKEASLW